jgi:hypothetical protein
MLKQVRIAVVIAAALLATLLVSGAFAQQIPAADTPPASDKVATSGQGLSAYDMVGKMFAAIEAGISGISRNAFAGKVGQRIAGTLCLLCVTWSILKHWMLGKDWSQILADLVPPTIMYGLVTFAMDANLGAQISGLIAWIASNISSGSSENAVTVMANLAQTAMSVFDLKPPSPELTFSGALMLLVGYGAKLVAAILLIACAAMAAAIYELANVMVAIAVGLGPLFYAWSVWKPTEFLFQGWLTFTIQAGLQKLMVVVMADLVGGVITSMTGQLAPLLHNSTADFPAYAGILLMAAVSTYLMAQAPSMARGLVSGAGTLGMGDWTRNVATVGHAAAATGSAAGRAATGADRSAGAGYNAGRSVGAQIGLWSPGDPATRQKTVSAYVASGLRNLRDKQLLDR